MQLDSRFIKVAHDPGDPVLCSHCPFCGSGQITGRSDGGIDCAFCGQSFIVRVQPAFPGMPQAPGMGAPTDVGPDMMGGMPPGMEGEEGMPPEGMPPGMEGEDEGGPPFGDEEAGAEEEEGAPPGQEEEGEEEGEEGGSSPPPFKKKSALTYCTIAGDKLGEDAYVRHLAILLSGHHPAVLARIRREAAGERDWEGDAKKVQAGTCERCGSHVTLTRGHWFDEGNDFMCPDGEEEHQVTGKGPGGQFHPTLSRRQAYLTTGDDPHHRAKYDEGYSASENHGSYRGRRSPLEDADLRNEPDSWYQGYMDHATDRPYGHAVECPAHDHDAPGCTLHDDPEHYDPAFTRQRDTDWLGQHRIEGSRLPFARQRASGSWSG